MHMTRMAAGVLSAALLATVLPGLVLAQDEGPFAAEGTVWSLTTLSGDALPEGVEVTLLLDDGSVNGNAGCNTYFGGYEIDATTLTFPEPLGATRAICEEQVQAVEDAYLPLLQSTAGWSVDDAGTLSLTDADGIVTLAFDEPAVDITATDLQALAIALAGLQAQIDQSTTEIAALTEAAGEINVKRLDRRVGTVESAVAAVDKKIGEVNVKKLEKRLKAAEKGIAENAAAAVALDDSVGKLRARVKAAEKALAAHDRRLAALDEAVFTESP